MKILDTDPRPGILTMLLKDDDDCPIFVLKIFNKEAYEAVRADVGSTTGLAITPLYTMLSNHRHWFK